METQAEIPVSSLAMDGERLPVLLGNARLLQESFLSCSFFSLPFICFQPTVLGTESSACTNTLQTGRFCQSHHKQNWK